MQQLDFDGANSKISADKIQGQSATTVTVPTGHVLAGTDANSITVNGVNAVAVAHGTSGNVLTSTGSAWTSSAPAGAGLTNGSNVVSVTITDARTQTATSTYADITSGFQASITPSATSSDILVMLNMCSANTGDHHFFRVVRDGSLITGGVGDAGGSRSRTLTHEYHVGSANNMQKGSGSWFVDTSISTTSAVTYKVQVVGGSTVCINRGGNDNDNATTGRSISTLTLIELL